MAAPPLFVITTEMYNGKGEAIVLGTLLFIVNKNDNTLLKGTEVATTPGLSISLAAGEYKVFYADESGSQQLVGTITVTEAAALTDLLDEVP